MADDDDQMNGDDVPMNGGPDNKSESREGESKKDDPDKSEEEEAADENKAIHEATQEMKERIKVFRNRAEAVMGRYESLLKHIDTNETHRFTEHPLDNLFDLVLPETQTRELPSSENFRIESLEDLVLRTTIGVSSFCPVVMFAERGPYSGHFYQPKVNHRQVDFISFAFRQDSSLTSKPLCESMVAPNELTGFSEGNQMGLYCYQVTRLNEHPDGLIGVIESPATLTFSVGSSENEFVQMNKMGEILGLKAETLTLATFVRLLSVFGLRRNQKYVSEETVDVREIADFFEIICRHNIGTRNGLAHFLDEFQLRRFYYLNNIKSIPEQLSALFTVIRSLVPFRIAAYDGRHRFCLCCYFATGFFAPNSSLLLNQIPFESLDAVEEGERRFEECELFRRQTFMVTIDRTPPEGDLGAAYKIMSRLGVKTTTSHDLAVKTDWRSTICRYLSHVQQTKDLLNKLTGLTFDNFWSVTKWEYPYASLLPDLIEFIAGSPESSKGLLKEDVKQEWDVIFRAMGNTAQPGLHILGLTERGKAPTKIGRTLAIFLTLLKNLVVDEKKLTQLRTYFQLTEWNTEQGKILPEDMVLFRGLSFIQSYILYPTLMVAEYCTKRCIAEKCMIEKARNAKDDRDLADDLHANYPRFVHFLPQLNFPDQKKSNIVSDNSLNVEGSSALTKKMNAAIHTTLLADVIETVNEFGFNGKIEYTENANHMLHLYVNGFDFANTDDDEDDRLPIITPPCALKLRGRYSTPLLLYCWKEYIERTVNIVEPEIKLLLPLAPSKDMLNGGKKLTDCGYAGKEGVFKEHVRQLFPDAKSFVPRAWLFSTFLKGVKDGSIDCDCLPIISKPLTKPYAAMVRQYKTETRGNHKSPQQYTPKKKEKSAASSPKKKSVKESLVASYVSALGAVFNFTEDGVKTRQKKNLAEYSKDDLFLTLEHYFKQGLVKKVLFDSDKIKKLHERGTTPPKNGAGGKIYAKKVREQKEKEKRKIDNDTLPTIPNNAITRNQLFGLTNGTSSVPTSAGVTDNGTPSVTTPQNKKQPKRRRNELDIDAATIVSKRLRSQRKKPMIPTGIVIRPAEIDCQGAKVGKISKNNNNDDHDEEDNEDIQKNDEDEGSEYVNEDEGSEYVNEKEKESEDEEDKVSDEITDDDEASKNEQEDKEEHEQDKDKDDKVTDDDEASKDKEEHEQDKDKDDKATDDDEASKDKEEHEQDKEN